MAKNLRILVRSAKRGADGKNKTVNLSLPLSFFNGLINISASVIGLFKREIKTENVNFNISDLRAFSHFLNEVKDEEPFVFVEIDDDDEQIIIRTEN